MKSIVIPSDLRAFVTSLVLVSFAGQQLAFAAPLNRPAPQAEAVVNDVFRPLPEAKNAKQGVLVIEIAESRPFGSYFLKGGTAQEIARLNADMKSLATANAAAGIADDLEKFQPWWEANQASILLSRSKVNSVNLESFFTQVFIMFKADETKAQKDPNAFLGWLSSKVTSPLVRYASFTAFAVVYGTFLYTLGLVKGAMVAGPAASMIGALVDPIVRPIREKASIIGSRLLGSTGVKLSAKLFKEAGGNQKGAAKDLHDLAGDVQSARAEAMEAKQLLNSMGYDMTPAQFSENMSKIHTIWNKTNQVWVQTNPSLYKDGRDVFSNAIALRPQAYSGQVMQSLQGAEQARQGIEQHIDRLISRTGRDAKVVETTVVDLLRAVEINERASEANSGAAAEGLAKSKDALKALGASDYQVERIIELRLAELVNVRHTAYTLATNVIHEIQYPEYNRALPEDVKKIQRTLRDGTCLDYFHHEYREQVTKILAEMDIKLETAGKAIEAAAAAPNSPLKVVPTREEHMAPVKQAERPGVSGYLKDQALRATTALGRLNRMRGNAVAIERTGELRGEKKATESQTRAEDAVRIVGRK